MKSEALYTMVIKSPKSIRATDLEEQDKPLPVSDRSDSSDPAGRGEEEKEEEAPREPAPEPDGPGQPEVIGQTPEAVAESPIMWEYKLPAPPPAFKDAVTSHSSTAPEDTSTTGSVSDGDTDSSISIDSLQVESRDDIDDQPEAPPLPSAQVGEQPEVDSAGAQEAGRKLARSDKRPEVVSEPEVVTGSGPEVEADSIVIHFEPKGAILNEFVSVGSVVVDCTPEVIVEAVQHPHPETLTLNEGSDLQGETTTEDVAITTEPPEAEASLPPCSPSPPDEEEEPESPPELPEKPEMRFSISTYHRRVKKEGLSYDKKLNRSESFSTTPQPKTRTLASTGSLDEPKPEAKTPAILPARGIDPHSHFNGSK